MATRSPKFGITLGAKGWFKSVNGSTKRICGPKMTGEEADEIFATKFAALHNIGQQASLDCDDHEVKKLMDVYIHHRRLDVAHGKLVKRTLDEYEDIIQDFLASVGSSTPFSSLTPLLFTRCAQAWDAKWGACRKSKGVAIVRSAFNWLKAHRYIADVPQYGDFVQATQAEFRKEEFESNKVTVFSPKEIALLLAHADTVQKAWILVGLNCADSNTDISELRTKYIDLDGGIINQPRTKTWKKRRCPLWPETITALKAALPKSKLDGYAFSTQDGMQLVQGPGLKDRLGERFLTLMEKAGVYIEGRGFKAMRKVFTTEAAKHAATLFVKRITGHNSAEEDRIMDEHYTTGDVDEVLCRISDGVRRYVLSETSMARLEEPLPLAVAVAAPKQSKRAGLRQGKRESSRAGKGTRGRNADRQPFLRLAV